MNKWRETDFGKIPIDWDLKKIAELKSSDKNAIAMGPFGSNIKADNFVSEGVPIIRGANLNYEKYVGGDFVFLSEEKANDLKGSNCKPNDLVFTHRGTIGQVGLVPKGTFPRYVISQSGMKLTVDEKLINSEFLFYFFKSKFGQHQLLKYEAQVGVPSISNPLSSLKEILVPVPPLTEQHSIAQVLGSIDSKVELLHRQNDTFETLAGTLFRRWFVEERDKSWKRGKVKDLFRLQRGFDLPAQNRSNGKYPILSASGITGYHDEFKVQGPGVTTGRSGLLGKVFYVSDEFWPLNTSLFVVEYRIATPLFAYQFLKTVDLSQLNAGSAVPTLNRNDVHDIECQLPPRSLISKFDETVAPYFKKMALNVKQISTLTQLRDTLLPRLMSGEVRVRF